MDEHEVGPGPTRMEGTMSREQLLATTFVELADTLTEDVDVLDFLQNLVDRGVQLLGAAAAGLLLVDLRGDLELVASSTHAVPVVDLLTLATSEGPCRDAFRSGLAVVNVPGPEAGVRWPSFARAARHAGYRTHHAQPLRLRSQVLGTLCLLHAADGRTLDQDDLAILEALTKVVTIRLLQERTPRQKEILGEQLQAALNLRIAVEQAKGVVAEHTGVGVDEAFDLIDGYRRTGGGRLGEVALSLLDGSLRPDVLLRSAG